MGIDLLAASGHKGLMGPPGTGFLYVREGLEVRPLLFGGTGMLSDSEYQPGAMPERLESGTLNTIGLAGLKAAIEYVEHEGLEKIRTHEIGLLEHLLDGLAEIPGLKLYGPAVAERHGSAVSLTVSSVDPSTLGFRLDREYGICCRTGLHCAPDAHRTIGTYPAGTVRVSPGYFNTGEEIECFLHALRTLVSAG
jgi:selenocysteine lyase/cysteine desulfurase